MAATPASRCVLLIHQIPPKPDYLRVKIGRRLAQLGAVAIKNSVYVLPAADSTVEDFQWVVREIVTEGGEASVCHAAFVDGLGDDDIELLFRAARSIDYEEIATAARAELKAFTAKRAGMAEHRAQARAELGRLTRRLAGVAAIDFFGARTRSAAEEAVGILAGRLRAASPTEGRPDARDVAPAAVIDPRDVRGRIWVTREAVFVDRIASAWLIRRFIDPEARFTFVAADGYVPAAGELRFDMFEAEFTHEGDRCTFETLLARFGLQADPALRAIGEIVHDIDVKDAKYGRAEVAGVERLLTGVAAKYPADVERLAHGAALFDALCEALGHGVKARSTWAGAPMRRKSRQGRRR
jgi:hypothetical protein